MKENPSFEDALRHKMNELPLPDENESWQKMKALLEEKEKRRGFLFFRYEKAVGGALLLLLLCLWLYSSWEKTKTPSSDTIVSLHQTTKQQKTDAKKSKESVTDKASPESTSNLQQEDSATHSSTSGATTATGSSSSQQAFSLNKKEEIITIERSVHQKRNYSFAHQSAVTNPVITADVNKTLPDNSDNHSVIILPGNNPPHQAINLTHDSAPSAVDISSENASPVTKNIDSSSGSFIKTDSLSTATNASAANAAKANIVVKRRNPFFIAAGIGIKQSIPIGGQRFVSYNDTAKKTWLADYIPFLYIRLEKDKKWFVQGEFHYASPRLVKAFSYYQKTTPDYSHGNTTTDAYQLQKTWYTQIPVSVNIYVKPSLSVGAGVVYSHLANALSKKQTSFSDAISGTHFTGTVTLPVTGFTDSFLYKTNTSLLLQADYAKDKWSFGLRYLQDLQPYLTYTSPGGQRKDKRNTSLELMIRYCLFRSPAFRLAKQ